jgi:hypothetical protein
MHEGFFHGNRPQFGPNDCYECGWPGHLARNCQKKESESKRLHGKEDITTNAIFPTVVEIKIKTSQLSIVFHLLVSWQRKPMIGMLTLEPLII